MRKGEGHKGGKQQQQKRKTKRDKTERGPSHSFIRLPLVVFSFLVGASIICPGVVWPPIRP